MRQVRMLLGMLVLAVVLSLAPMGSAQSVSTFVTLNPGTGPVWATAITGGAAAASCGRDEGQQGNQGEDETECDNEDASTTPSTTSLNVAGYYVQNDPVTNRVVFNNYVWNGSTFSSVTVNITGAIAVFVTGLTSAGHTAGFYDDAKGIRHGFLQAGTTVQTIDPPGSLWTRVDGMNATDQVVGTYFDSSKGLYRGFVYAGGTYTPLDFPTATHTWATGINSRGDMVGYYTTGVTYQGWLMPKGGAWSAIPFNNGVMLMKPYGINTAGEIVGEFADATWKGHGFRLSNGILTVIDVPSATTSTYTVVNAIDDMGRVSGEYLEKWSVTNPSPRQLGFKSP